MKLPAIVTHPNVLSSCLSLVVMHYPRNRLYLHSTFLMLLHMQ
jgi:hypothetical protein